MYLQAWVLEKVDFAGVSGEGWVEQLIRTCFLCVLWHLSYLSGLCSCVHQYVGLLTKNLTLNLSHVLKK